MKLNREQIIKALECCVTVEFGGDCPFECPYAYNDDCEYLVFSNALSLIKELTEENERLRDKLERTDRALIVMDKAHNKLFTKSFEIQADTVRKMQERLKEAPIKVGLPLFGLQTKDEIEVYANELILQMRDAIDQIAKEMLEVKEND